MAQGNFSNVRQYNGQAPAKTDNTPALISLLSKNMKAIKSALPKHLTAERVARVALNSIRKNPKLMQCAPETLCMAIMETSSLGLEIDSRGHAYLVPFWNKKNQCYEMQLMIGYKGMLDLAWRSGKLMSIMAEVVGENDKFDVTLGLEPVLEHKPNLVDGRGEIIAAYAVAIMKDGSRQFVVVPKADLDKVRESSKSKDDGAWVSWYEEMAKKTALKRLCKLLPLSPEIQRATVIDDIADAGISLSESVIDIPLPESITPEPQPAAEPVAEPAPEPEKPQSVDASYTFECPSNGKQVTEEACASCKSRNGCPQWETV